MSHTSERVRREWKIGDAKRDAGLTTPDDIQRFDNISEFFIFCHINNPPVLYII